MFNMIRMDLFRIRKSKSLYIILGICTVIAVLTAGLFYMISNQYALNWLAQRGLADGFKTAEDLSEITALEYSSGTVFGGGLFPPLMGVFCALFFSMDYKSGYIKNILSYHNKRWSYVFSKMVSFSIVNVLSIIFIIIVSQIAAGILQLGFAPSGLGDYAWYILTNWVLQVAFSALISFVILLTRSEAAGIATAFLVISGAVTVLLEQLVHVFGKSIAPYSLVFAVQDCPVQFDWAVNSRILGVGIIWLVIYLALCLAAVYKKDVV